MVSLESDGLTEAASPQLEDGHTRIANELLEALAKCEIAGSLFRLMLAIMRETYGYQAKERKVKRTRLAAILGVTDRRIRQLLVDAQRLNMITVQGWSIGVQKDWTRWSKPEGNPSAFGRENRKAALPLFEAKPEGTPSAFEETKPEGSPSALSPEPEDENRKDTLPPKSEGHPSAQRQRKKERTSTARTDSAPDDGAGSGELRTETDQQAIIREAFETLTGKPLPKPIPPPGYSGAASVVADFGIPRVEEWLTWLRSNRPKGVPHGSNAWRWFCKQFRRAMERDFEWQTKRVPQLQPGQLVHQPRDATRPEDEF